VDVEPEAVQNARITTSCSADPGRAGAGHPDAGVGVTGQMVDYHAVTDEWELPLERTRDTFAAERIGRERPGRRDVGRLDRLHAGEGDREVSTEQRSGVAFVDMLAVDEAIGDEEWIGHDPVMWGASDRRCCDAREDGQLR